MEELTVQITEQIGKIPRFNHPFAFYALPSSHEGIVLEREGIETVASDVVIPFRASKPEYADWVLVGKMSGFDYRVKEEGLRSVGISREAYEALAGKKGREGVLSSYE